MLPPLGRSRSQGSDTFCSGIIRQSKGRSRSIDCEPRLIDYRPDAAAKDSEAELAGLVTLTVESGIHQGDIGIELISTMPSDEDTPEAMLVSKAEAHPG